MSMENEQSGEGYVRDNSTGGTIEKDDRKGKAGQASENPNDWREQK